MHQTGDSSEPHLINASMRCMMAFATATGRAMSMERKSAETPQVVVTAEEVAMLTGKTEMEVPSAEKVCVICGKSYTLLKQQTNKYCSVECRKEAERRRGENRRAEISAARVQEEARRKEAMAHLGELTREAHEAGLSYGQYMAQKRITEGVTGHG